MTVKMTLYQDEGIFEDVIMCIGKNRCLRKEKKFITDYRGTIGKNYKKKTVV